MSSGWLSVGKSFKAVPQKSEDTSLETAKLQPRHDIESNAAQSDGKRKIESPVDKDSRKKNKKDKKDKKDKHKKDGRSSKKSKKDKKGRKEHQDKPSTALVISTHTLSASSVVEMADFSSSDSGFSSSDDEPRQFNSTHSIIRQNRAEIMSGTSELTFLPNGEVVLLPSFARNDASSVSWMVDSRGDKGDIMYAGTQPSAHLYTVHPGAKYYTNFSQLSNTRFDKPTASITSAQQYRHSTQRPSGIVVPAKQQHREYDQANKTDQVFMHRTQLLSERRRETRLHNKYRYFAPAARSVLSDTTVNRLNMSSTTANSSVGSTSNVTVMLPFSFVDHTVLAELGFANSPSTATDNTTTISTEDNTYTTTAARAQTLCNTLTRDINQALREKPHDLHTILHAVSVQDTICTLQLVAAGRPYSVMTSARANNKTYLALQKSVTERKIAILEQSIEHNRSNEHIMSVLYERLVAVLIQSKQADKINSNLARAIEDCPTTVALRMIQLTYHMGVFNTSACGTLTNNVNNIYSEVSQAALNALAAQQLNTTLHGGIYNTINNTVSKSLQQEYQQLMLEQQLIQLQCDMLVHKVQIERSAGNVEKAIAMLQAVLDFNLSRSSVTKEEYSTYWDSECTRMGESYFVLPSHYMQHTINNSSSNTDTTRSSGMGGINDSGNSSNKVQYSVGYDAWVSAGCPAEPLPDSLFSPLDDRASTIMATYLCDDLSSVSAVVDKCTAAATVAAITTHQDTSPLVVDIATTATSAINSTTAATTLLTNAPTNTTTTTVTLDAHVATQDVDQNAAAAEYFLQQMLVSDIIIPVEEEEEDEDEDEQDVGNGESLSTTNTTAIATTTTTSTNKATATTDNNDSNTNNVVEAEEEMVYSRLHGYKIKVHKESTGAIYKKILTDMGSAPVSDTVMDDNTPIVSANNTNSDANELTATRLKLLKTADTQPTTTLTPATASLCTQYKHNLYAKYTQYRPLRAAATVDRVSVEEQPERVIFSNDIESALFKAEYTTNSSIIDGPMRQKLKQCVVIRVLQALGVVFSHNMSSHGLFSRTCELSSQDIHGVLNIDEAVLYDNIISTRATSTTATTATTTSSLANPVSCYVSHLLAVGEAMLPISTIPNHLVQKHLLCVKLGLDSELNFIIRIISDILSASTNGSTTAGNVNSGNSDALLSAEFVAQLRCVLVRLLTIRCHSEMNVRGSMDSGSVIAHWRAQCRALLEASIGVSSSVPVTGTPSASGNTNIALVCPPVGELGLWAEYLQCEILLGQTAEAMKLADKVLKSLQPSALIPVPAAAVSPAQYHNADKLIYTAILLALQPPTQSVNTTSNDNNTIVSTHMLHCTSLTVHNALSLLTQYAHNLHGFNPIFGKYNSELKPTKSSVNKAGKNSNTAVARLSEECIVVAMEILQNSILVEVEKLQEQINRHRRSSSSSSGVNLRIEDVTQIVYASHLYHLVLLMAWMQFLSTLYTSTTTAINTKSPSSSTTGPHPSTHAYPTSTLDDAVAQGDAVFAAVFTMLRTILLVPSDTVDASLSSSYTDGTKPAEGERSHKYSRFFSNFMSSKDESGSAPASASIPELQYAYNVPLTSEAEVNALLLLERLHCTRLHFLLQTSTSTAINTSGVNSSISGKKPLQLSHSNRNTLSKAVQSAIRDFPLNKYIQSVHSIYHISQPAGVTHMRVYYKHIAQNRQIWGGNMQPTEILHMLCVEIYQPNKTLLLDPLQAALTEGYDVYAVFDIDGVYNYKHSSNTQQSAVAQALTMCHHWSHDSFTKVRTFLEATLSNHSIGAQMSILWVYYIHLETSQQRFSEAKRLFFRAVSVCGWNQNLFTLCWGPLKQSFTDSELTSLAVMMEQRGLHPLRVVESV